ncbi:putative CAMK family protein kinase [Blattamonas nauphoetae]|uniref:non-specific serine/threonine protein kinase n=1 Tax=Blattamonas nauphoetae TaxID=2049346 RepID=A0ABQ9X3X3_9EUKA|nr:putative CAMK family protein kinase [Blattamonas nauphoetae]
MTSKLDVITPPGYSKPKKISSGAFGQVLKVTHEGNGIEYAVKVLPMLKEGDKERVSREVEMLTRFAHARIVRLHESIDMGGHQAIVMELGTRSLKDLISEYESRGELIPLPLTVMILTDICEGLLWMHTHPSGSTAHGDLKPENVLLRENNRAFLCDLGGSAPLDQKMTSTIGELGTFEYNSPERVMDSKGLATAASDVWSLGVLAYRLVTGRQLFEGLQLFQLSVALHTFDETRIPSTIPASVRAVLVKMLEPNVALRATSRGLLDGGLLEGMLGSSTDLSRMKSIQLATVVSEIKESLNDAEVQERTMELSMEKAKLLLETRELEGRLRSLQMSLQQTRSRNVELETEEECERRQQLHATPLSPITISAEDNVLSTRLEMPTLQFLKDEERKRDETSYYAVSGNTITRTGVDKDQEWSTTLFEERITKGVVSVAITVLAMPKAEDSKEGLMFGLVDAHSRELESYDRLGERIPNSIALAPRKGRLHIKLPSTKHMDKTFPIAAQMKEGDRVMLEVDLDARPRTAVFIINGNVPLTFVSGLPPSIRFGLSMKNEGVSVRFDGMSRLKRATPLRRVNEIKWNAEDLRDSENMYMNGMRSSVLTVQTQMPPLIFSDPSHFVVKENRILSTGLATKENNGRIESTSSSFFLSEPISDGIVAISFTYLMDPDSSPLFFGLLDASMPIPNKGQTLGLIHNSIALSSHRRLYSTTEKRQKEIKVSDPIGSCDTVVIEINMDSYPRTAQFFINGTSTNVVVVKLPRSVRVGISTRDKGMQVRFNRITHLNRESPFTDQMDGMSWPTTEPPPATESNEDGKQTRQVIAMKLPELIFTHKSHFTIRSNVLTRTEKGTDEKGRARPSTVLFSEPITKGVVSVTFAVLMLAESVEEEYGSILFGLLDSSAAVPPLEQVLGMDVKHSIGLSTNGLLHVFNQTKLKGSFSYKISKKDRVVMEVNMDSTPRTVQFFRNGKAGKCYVSGIPESVRIGFSADVMGTSLEIPSIIHSTQATPLSDKMKEIKWNDTKESLSGRDRFLYGSIRREADVMMPALITRTPEHFKIEGNVITRTAFGSIGLDTPFSTVMLDGVVKKKIKSVAVTILALPETQPSFALCSSDGMISRIDWKTKTQHCHSPLRVGDQVVLGVNTLSDETLARFFVNGMAGQNEISQSYPSQRIGFSLAGPGTSIRIDAITEFGEPSQTMPNPTPKPKTKESQPVPKQSQNVANPTPKAKTKKTQSMPKQSQNVTNPLHKPKTKKSQAMPKQSQNVANPAPKAKTKKSQPKPKQTQNGSKPTPKPKTKNSKKEKSLRRIGIHPTDRSHRQRNGVFKTRSMMILPDGCNEGAFGQVLKVTHEGSGVKYAVKVLPMLKEGDKERVSHEVEMLTRDLGGSATLDQQMTSSIGELGTFEYNSPERVMDSKGLATAASDVWSLGVLAYRMVTGRGLFSGVSLLQLGSVLEKFNESRIPTTIAASVRAVLVKMLEPNVTLRATTSALLDGGLLEGMLGVSTDLSRMKSIQLATFVNEIKESLNDAEVQEKMMELSYFFGSVQIQRKDYCSIAFAPKNGSLHAKLPSTKQTEKKIPISARMSEGDRVVLEVDMDARPRTAVFIINGIVPLAFVSGLPPSIRFGLSMKNEGVSVRFDGMSRLKRATPLRRVNEIKWNPEDLRDRYDMYMNGMRSSVLTVQTQMPSLDFTDPSHFRVDDNRITSNCFPTIEENGKIEPTWSSFFLSEPISEGIVAISFTYLMDEETSYPTLYGLIDANEPLQDKRHTLGEYTSSIGLSSDGRLQFLTSEGQKKIQVSSYFNTCQPLIVEVNMDSNPRTAQFFVDRKQANVVVIDLPESVRVGYSTKDRGVSVRFDRITHLNRGTPFTDQMNVVEWPAAEPFQAEESKNNNEEERTFRVKEKDEKDRVDEDSIDDNANPEKMRSEKNEEHIDHSSEQMMENARDEAESDDDSGDDSDEEKRHCEGDSDDEDEGADGLKKKRILPTMKLPELLFTNKTHFTIRNSVLTRTEKGTDEKGRAKQSTVLISEPITKGVVSVTFVVLTIAESGEEKGSIHFGLLDSSAAVPKLGRVLGKNVKHSIGLSTIGRLYVFNQIKLEKYECYHLKKDCIVMEVNMDSTPRTVQFFRNGEALDYYLSGIPESVRIGFSADVMGTSVQITSIIHSTQATPLSNKIKEISWTDTEESYQERKKNHFKLIRREADVTMPALLFRNPEHFKIEGNVITRTAFDFNGIDSPFSTVMLDGVVTKKIKSVAVTILALPQTEHSCGTVLIGCMWEHLQIPKSPKGLGIGKKYSCALCSIDGMTYVLGKTEHSDPCHSPLRIGDQVVLEVNTRSKPDISRFFVNGKAGQNDVSDFNQNQRIGFSLAGPGTSIRIDAITELDEPSQNVTRVADNTKTNESEDIDKARSSCRLCQIF